MCDRLSRRAMLRIGALAPLGLSLPGLLAALPSFLRADAPHELASLREAASVVRVVEALRN